MKLDWIKNEPTLLSGLVQAVLGLLLAFGVSVSDEQTGSVMAVTAIILAIVVRSVVIPVHKVPAPVTALEPTEPEPDPQPMTEPDQPNQSVVRSDPPPNESDPPVMK